LATAALIAVSAKCAGIALSPAPSWGFGFGFSATMVSAPSQLAGENAFYVWATLEDGTVLWSSPVNLVP
jgi:hypothetical protein